MSNEVDFPLWNKMMFSLSDWANKSYLWWLALGLLFLPLIALAFYNHPSADDYFYAVDTMKKGFWGAQQNSYRTWSGRYVSTLWLTGNPLAAGSLTGYRLLSVGLLLGTCCAVFFFIKTVLKKRTLDGSVAALAVCFSFLYLSQMPSLTEGFYWLAGAMTYQLPNVLMLVVIALLLAMRTEYSFQKLITVLLLSVMICGGNETSMLELLYVLTALMVYEYSSTGNIPKYYYTVLIVSLIAAVMVLLAPGNAIRASYFQGEKNILKAAGLSVWSSFFKMKEWLPNMLLLLVLFLPFLKKLESNTVDQRRIRKPVLILYPLFIFGLLIVGFLPAYWSVGSEPPARTLNVLYWLFIAACLHYTILWITYIRQEGGLIKIVPVYIQFIFLFLLLVNVVPMNNLRTASMDLISGRARIYNKEQNDRYAILRKKEGQQVVVDSLLVKPKSLFLTDIEAQPEDWKNVCVADYFKLKSIAISKPIE